LQSQTLSVSKSADESEIKRAYKKLALRFHPDKNAAPSAEAAFKAINAAVETLTDASKRRMYDQLGHEGATSAAASGGGGGGGSPFGGGFHGGNMHEFTPEDMFNMFFNGGGAFGGGGFRTYNFGPGMRRRAAPGGRRGGGAEEEAAPQGGINTLFNLLPIFLLLLSMSGLFSGSGDASWQRPYSIQKAAPYTEPRYTASFGVTKDIPYFVTTTFQPSKSDLRRMEAQVEAEFKNDLYMRCDRQKRHKNRQMSDVSY
jgi:DnaJ family protein B protein 12